MSKKINYDLLKETLTERELPLTGEVLVKPVKMELTPSESPKLVTHLKESSEKRLPLLPARSKMLRKKIAPKLSAAKREPSSNNSSGLAQNKISADLFNVPSDSASAKC